MKLNPGVNILVDALTLASAVHKSYRKNFMPLESIVVCGEWGFSERHFVGSNACQQMLDWHERLNSERPIEREVWIQVILG